MMLFQFNQIIEIEIIIQINKQENAVNVGKFMNICIYSRI
jgi:hypothetical protein